MTADSFSLNEEELALLLAPTTLPANSKLLRVLWFQQPLFQVNYPIDHIQVSHLEELQLQLQQTNEFDAIVFNCIQLNSAQLSLLANLLEEQSQMSVFLVGKLPDMAFDIADFTYCAEQIEFEEQFTFWCYKINRQYQRWLNNKRLYWYSPEPDSSFAEQLSHLQFTNNHRWWPQQENLRHQLRQANLVLVVVYDNDPNLVEVIEILASVLHRPGLFLVFQSNSRLRSSIILLAKHYGLNLYTCFEQSLFQQQVAYLSRQFFRRYRHKLNQQEQAAEHRCYLIKNIDDQQLFGYWDWPILQQPSDSDRPSSKPALFNANYWPYFKQQLTSNHASLNHLATHYPQQILVFSPDLPMDHLSRLIRLKQQHFQLAWQPNLIAQLKNQVTVFELIDILVLSLDMWILLNINNDNKDFWQQLKLHCQEHHIALAILGVQPNLIQYWRDKGFDLLIHREEDQIVKPKDS
ncbi:hypothetical protein [Agarivorans sp. Z349TD_8]|uniref:hypothetical protein n=1 Tax=Agarivorans sp. Z349TD_8 TaxID=3421434 RepID=UPI003D7D5A86